MLRATVVALACSLASLTSASMLRAPSVAMRLRGGDGEEDAANLAAEVPPPAALTKDEIMTKLNGCPVFCIQNKDGGIIGMSDAEGDKKSVAWFTDAEEARAILKAMSSQNPEAGLQLACHGLGGAFTQCNGWGDQESKTASSQEGHEVELRIQGNHALVNQVKPKLIKLLEDNGFEPGCWQHPVFLCEKLASPQIMPVFLSPKDLARVWEKTGKKPEDLPNEVTVLDLRMLVAQMQTDANPWSIFHLVASPEAIQLAGELTGELEPLPEGSAGDAAAAKAEAAVEESTEEEDEEVLI